MVTARAIAVALILTLGSLTVLLAPPEAAAQGGAPWYGPVNRDTPTAGWAFRIPVVVTNDEDVTVRDGVAHVDLDFGKILVQNGWINQTVGNEARARGFTLDPDSIRVVEYERGFRDFRWKSTAGDVYVEPSLFYPALFETPTRGRDYDPATNPIGTVLWRLDGALAPEVSRFYYVYFNALEYGSGLPAPKYKEPDAEKAMAPLEAFGWSPRGHVFYGYEAGAAGNSNRLDVYIDPMYNEGTVTLYTYELGRPRVYEPPPGSRVANPFVLNASTYHPWGIHTFSLPQNELYKIESTIPLVVASRGAVETPVGGGLPAYASGAYAPATNGQFKGKTFKVPVYAPELWAYSTQTGQTTVRYELVDAAGNEVDDGSITLSTASPAGALFTGLQIGSTPLWAEVTSTSNDILLQYVNPKTGNAVQAPSWSGSPTGSAYALRAQQDDLLRIEPASPAKVRAFHPEVQGEQIFPLGATATTAPRSMTPGCGGGAPLVVNQSFQPNKVVWVRTEPATEGAAAGRVFVETGGHESRPAGYYGGEGGKRVFARGPAYVMAHFNETRVTIRECTTKEPIVYNVPLQADGFYSLLQGNRLEANGAVASGFYEIESNKPIAVFNNRITDHYAHFVGGRLRSVSTDVQDLEFRGSLVDLRSAERPGLQVFKTTGPNRPVDFKLTAYNLGQWLGGDNLADTVRIRCETEKTDWEIKGCDRDIPLDSNQAETFTVTVTPRNAEPGERGVINVVASSGNAPNMTSSVRLLVLVEVTYGVGTWFDVEGGLKTIDPPVSVNPGERHVYKVVVKNTGSVEDRYDIVHVEAEDRRGWGVRLVRDEADVEETRSLLLLPGESETLKLIVTAPERPTLTYFDVIVKATSVASSTATDKVSSATRIRADIKFQMAIDEATKLAPPAKPANFVLTLLNTGNDIARITLLTEGLLPEGWRTRILDPDGNALDEVNLGVNTPFNATLEVTPPEGARAGDLASVRVAAETAVGEETRRDERTATVIVRQVHNLTLPEPAEVSAAPGEVLRYVLDLTNAGNGDELIEVLQSSVRPAWRLRVPTGDALTLPRSENVPLEIELTVPEATPAKLYDVNFTLRLSREATTNVTLPVVVRAVRQMAFEVPADIRVSPAQEFRFPVDVRNTGNVRDVATLGADTPPGWSVRFEPETVLLGPGEATRVTVIVNASKDAADGGFPLTLTGTFPGGARASEASTTVTVARPALALGEPVSLGSTKRGEFMIITVPVTNVGGMEAQDVRVALVVNGETVDYVTLGRVLPGETHAKVATLKWSIDRPIGDVKVVVNPEGNVVEPDDGVADNTAAVNFAKTGVPAPALPAALAFLALAAIALDRRRRLR